MKENEWEGYKEAQQKEAKEKSPKKRKNQNTPSVGT